MNERARCDAAADAGVPRKGFRKAVTGYRGSFFFARGAPGDELCVRMRLHSFDSDTDHTARDRVARRPSDTGRPIPALRNRPSATGPPQTDTRTA